MKDYDLLEKMIEATSAYVRSEISSEECTAKMVSSLNAYKEQLNIAFVSQQRELLYGFITWYNSKPKVQKGEHVYTTDVDEFLKP